ncbi:invasion associated locus B family protein [Roseovarius sp. SCSIO 43702]|uniref:invasion associated locus B family protein n=1 Tax=Roseovarius sp. SCSIO 43702 TaxID=2823043 RepID=UPI001C729EEB|nr:invasion associated locus B family protein [Roseovarius sp. SCSIO 43702]QYX57140.1 invasion associated locus B family protein [Roseovarius sp. SCSIO 43702]
MEYSGKRKRGLLAVFAFAASVTWLSCAGAPSTAQILQDWRVDCASGVCNASQTVAAEDGTWLATVRLYAGETAPTSDEVLGEILVPSGVHLASGLYLGFGERMIDAAWQRCTAEMCRAALAFDDGMLGAWRRGAASEVRYRPGPDAPVIAFDVSLMGLTDALAALEAGR